MIIGGVFVLNLNYLKEMKRRGKGGVYFLSLLKCILGDLLGM